MLRLPITLLFLFALPVCGSFYYGAIQDPVWIFTAFLSVCVLAYSVPVTMQLAPEGWIRQSVGLMLVFSVGLYLWAQYLSFYLQGSYLNRQFFFHFNLSTLVETWQVYYPLMILFAIWMLSLALSIAYFRHREHSKQASVYYITALLTVAVVLDPGVRQSFAYSMRTNNYSTVTSIEDIDWDSLGLNEAALNQTQIAAEAGKNLVLIYLEGVERHYFNEQIFPGLLPNLSRLNQEGWQLDNLYPVTGAMWTMGGIVASMCGTPLEHQTALGGNEVMFSKFLNQATCLPDVLANAGYEQTYMGGASLDFAGKGLFLSAHGVNTTLGKEELEHSLPDINYQGSWGLYDDSLLGFAINEFDRLASQDEPFNLTVLTLDTHRPTEERSESCGTYAHIDNPMLHSVHCTDMLVGNFIEQIQSHEAYEDTVVVVLSDHPTMANSDWTDFSAAEERFLYFNVLNSELQAPQVADARQMDLAPTILHLLEVEHNVGFLAGRNLFEDPVSARTIDPNHPFSREVLAFVNSQYLSVPEYELRYSLTRRALADVTFSEDSGDFEFREGELSFQATGADPYLILPALEIENPEESTLIFHVEVEEDTTAVVYFSPDSSLSFSEENTIARAIPRGNHALAFHLGDLNSDSRIRLDPGAHPGRYTISLLEIRE